MESHVFRSMPPEEPVVTAHLHPKTSLSTPAPTSVPIQPDRCTRLKANKATALVVQALSATSLQMAYQAQMTASSDLALWEEVCIITVAIQLQGRPMGLMVLQERAHWLNLTILSIKEK